MIRDAVQPALASAGLEPGDWMTLMVITATVLAAIHVGQRWAEREKSPKAVDERVHVRIAPPAAPMRQLEPAPQEVTSSMTQRPTVYRCIVNGRVTYSEPLDCRGSMPRQVPIAEAAPASDGVPAGLSDYQREMLRSADARIARNEAAARADIATRQYAATASRSECGSLAQQIESFDAAARQPQSSYQQDFIRSQRQQVRSRQAALHC